AATRSGGTSWTCPWTCRACSTAWSDSAGGRPTTPVSDAELGGSRSLTGGYAPRTNAQQAGAGGVGACSTSVPSSSARRSVVKNAPQTLGCSPKNDGHSLRIPEAAIPWDSGFLVNRGDHFEVRLTVPGVDDYYCQPHEAAGM